MRHVRKPITGCQRALGHGTSAVRTSAGIPVRDLQAKQSVLDEHQRQTLAPLHGHDCLHDVSPDGVQQASALVGEGPEHRVAGRQDLLGHGSALSLVGAQQTFGGLAGEHRRQLPGQVGGVLDPRVHALAPGRAVGVRRVAHQETAPTAVRLSEAFHDLVVLEAQEPRVPGRARSGKPLCPCCSDCLLRQVRSAQIPRAVIGPKQVAPDGDHGHE
mmetsp:Transcript_36907/g.102465  ORF Transcript_36907/g.102465 Transcript_36907/m.102465 type:complete len:215 (-) Transcript_36907:856-1500(-)